MNNDNPQDIPTAELEASQKSENIALSLERHKKLFQEFVKQKHSKSFNQRDIKNIIAQLQSSLSTL